MNVYNGIKWLVASSKILDHSNHDGGWTCNLGRLEQYCKGKEKNRVRIER